MHRFRTHGSQQHPRNFLHKCTLPTPHNIAELHGEPCLGSLGFGYEKNIYFSRTWIRQNPCLVPLRGASKRGLRVEARKEAEYSRQIAFFLGESTCVHYHRHTHAGLCFLLFLAPAPSLLTFMWAYFAEIEKPLPAGECYLHRSRSTFPGVGKCDCTRSRRGFYTRTSGS